jgi:hypothetical protein
MDNEDATNLADAEDVRTEAEAEVETEERLELDAFGNPVETAEADEAEPDEELEIERDGKRYKIPAALKAELMMQADYTRKTQELAEQRRAVEAQRSLVEQASQAELQAYSTLTAIDQQLARYQAVDWNRWFDDAPFEAQKASHHWGQLKEQRGQAAHYLANARQSRELQTQQDIAMRTEQGRAELERAIPGWSEGTAAKLVDFAGREFGFTPEELDEIRDPRIAKVLYAAFQHRETAKKQAAANRHLAAQQVQPAARVAAGAPPKAKADDRTSIDAWMKQRTQQVRGR